MHTGLGLSLSWAPSALAAGQQGIYTALSQTHPESQTRELFQEGDLIGDNLIAAVNLDKEQTVESGLHTRIHRYKLWGCKHNTMVPLLADSY